MSITRVSLSWISTSDINKSKKFFTEKLGLKVSSDSPEFGWSELVGEHGGSILGIGQDNEHSLLKAGQNAVVCFETNNIEETKKELEAKNVTFVGEIVEVPNIVKMIFFKDEDDNLFHLVQNLEK